jgi:small subunit ribosomal protein S8
MVTTDPIADMLTRIRNANKSMLEQVDIPASKMKERLAKVLKREGFIKDYQFIQAGVQGVLRVAMKYTPERGRVINGLTRISKPGLRRYSGKEDIPNLYGGMGVVIMSTPRGVMTGKKARKQGLGGEVLAYVW